MTDLKRIEQLRSDIKELAECQDKIKTITENVDVEMNHRRADDILCDILDELGLTDVTEAFGKIRKWYA